MFKLTVHFLVLSLCVFFVSCSVNTEPIQNYSEWCSAEQEEIDQRGVALEKVRQGLLADYNNELSKFLALDPEEISKSGLGLFAIEDTLYYKNHVNRNKFYDRMYPGTPDDKGSQSKISEKESCFFAGIDHCYALLVLDLHDGIEYVTLPFILRPKE